ncbi:MAG: hypothetical protein HQL36_02415 [Alphaproteobacteria bacterium]|nr:hypothetical protein [Alphaproteobacteria bacterium]
MTIRMFRIGKFLTVLLAAHALNGCVMTVQPAMQFMSFAMNGFSYAKTGKGVSDHALSAAMRQDCALLRPVMDGEGVCRDGEYQLATLLEVQAVDEDPAITAATQH